MGNNFRYRGRQEKEMCLFWEWEERVSEQKEEWRRGSKEKKMPSTMRWVPREHVRKKAKAKRGEGTVKGVQWGQDSDKGTSGYLWACLPGIVGASNSPEKGSLVLVRLGVKNMIVTHLSISVSILSALCQALCWYLHTWLLNMTLDCRPWYIHFAGKGTDSRRSSGTFSVSKGQSQELRVGFFDFQVCLLPAMSQSLLSTGLGECALCACSFLPSCRSCLPCLLWTFLS